MSCVALHTVETAGVDGDDRPLHINQIVFAQKLILSRRLAMSVPYASGKGKGTGKGLELERPHLGFDLRRQRSVIVA